jgi:formiminoglutamase
MDDELSLTQQPFKFYIHKLDEEAQKQLKEHKEKLIFLKGFPFDEGALLCNERPGSDRGPSVCRYAIETSPFYPFQKIDKVKIFDSGDVHSSSLLELSIPLDQAHQILQDEVKELLAYENSSVCIVGGSNDSAQSSFGAIAGSYPNSKIGIVYIDPQFDLFPSLDNKVTSKSSAKRIMEHESFTKNNCKLIYFGSQGSQCSKTHYDLAIQNKADIYWLEKNIRREFIESSHDIKTQAGQMMKKILAQLEKEVDIIMFSIDIAAINSNQCPGVSYPSVVGGLTAHETNEIALLAGISKKTKILDISEFNPTVESKKTSHLIAEIFYHFCRGVSERE